MDKTNISRIISLSDRPSLTNLFYRNKDWKELMWKETLGKPLIRFAATILIMNATSITAYAEVTLDGTLGASGPLSGPNYEIIHMSQARN